MRRPFTTAQAYARGYTHHAIKWKVRTGEWQRIGRGVFVEGAEPIMKAERALADVVRTGGTASGTLAGLLYGFDGVYLQPPYVAVPRQSRIAGVVQRHLDEADLAEVDGYTSTSAIRTLFDLAKTASDDRWEQAFESAVRKKLVNLDDVISSNARVRRVLARRPKNAPPTESLLETLMVQLCRKDPTLPSPDRQVEVFDRSGLFVARVDLAWPKQGVFLELDGQHHLDQPIHDARRESAIVAATGWLPGRFTWHEVTRVPNSTLRRVREIHDRASIGRIAS